MFGKKHKLGKVRIILARRDRQVEIHDIRPDADGGFTIDKRRYMLDEHSLYRYKGRWTAFYQEKNVKPIDPITGNKSEMTPADFHDAIEQNISRRIVRDVEEKKDVGLLITLGAPIAATLGIGYYLYTQIEALAAQNAELLTEVARLASESGGA